MSYQLWLPDLGSDKKFILEFWEKNQAKPLHEKYRWIYEGNPDGKAIVIMAMHAESGEPAGMLSVFPKKFVIKAKPCSAGILGDLIVNRKHRCIGAAMQLFKGAISYMNRGRFDFLYGFPNRLAEPVMKRCGFRHVGRLVRYVKIFKSRTQLQKKNIPSAIISLASSITDGLLKLTSKETWHRPDPKLIGKEVAVPDERFDRFCRERQNVFLIAGERTSSHISWKYLNDPDDVNKMYALFTADGISVAGFIVYRIDDCYIEIRDMVISDDDETAMSLYTYFFKHVRTIAPDGIEIRCLERNRLLPRLRRFGFREGNSGRNVYVHCPANGVVPETLVTDPENWYLFSSEEDT